MFRNNEQKIVRVKDPLNTKLAKLYADLLEKHNTLLTEHRELLEKLRETPLYATPSGEKLWIDEDQDDANYQDRLRLAPPVPFIQPTPDPFDDDRQDEAELRWASNLIGSAEIQ